MENGKDIIKIYKFTTYIIGINENYEDWSEDIKTRLDLEFEDQIIIISDIKKREIDFKDSHPLNIEGIDELKYLDKLFNETQLDRTFIKK